MGREARRAAALAVDNKGNRSRILVAHAEFAVILASDPRIVDVFKLWLNAMAYHACVGPPEWIQNEAQLRRAMAVIETAQIDHVAGVLQSMGVPWRWCAEALIKAIFPTMRHNAKHPGDLQLLTVTADTFGAAKGQAPPHDGREIAEAVRWFYRSRIQQPRERATVSDLAEEYAARENRQTDARSVVQDGIRQVETLLNQSIRQLHG